MVNHDIKGKIINITSIAGIKSGFDPYSVSKWGATCITKDWRKNLFIMALWLMVLLLAMSLLIYMMVLREKC